MLSLFHVSTCSLLWVLTFSIDFGNLEELLIEHKMYSGMHLKQKDYSSNVIGLWCWDKCKCQAFMFLLDVTQFFFRVTLIAVLQSIFHWTWKHGELNHINSVKFEFGDCSIHHYEISRVKWSYRQFQLSRDHISVKCVWIIRNWQCKGIQLVLRALALYLISPVFSLLNCDWIKWYLFTFDDSSTAQTNLDIAKILSLNFHSTRGCPKS